MEDEIKILPTDHSIPVPTMREADAHGIGFWASSLVSCNAITVKMIIKMDIMNISAHAVVRNQNNLTVVCQNYRGSKTFKIMYNLTLLFFFKVPKIPLPPLKHPYCSFLKVEKLFYWILWSFSWNKVSLLAHSNNTEDGQMFGTPCIINNFYWIQWVFYLYFN